MRFQFFVNAEVSYKELFLLNTMPILNQLLKLSRPVIRTLYKSSNDFSLEQNILTILYFPVKHKIDTTCITT